MQLPQGLSTEFPELHNDFFHLVSHIPVGVCRFLLDMGYSMTYGNQALLDLFGYTAEQFTTELGGKIAHTFLPEDRAQLMTQIDRALQSGAEDFCLEHRVARRDGRLLWVLVSGHFIPQGEGMTPDAYGVVVDITDRKQMEERLRIDEERFRLALAQMDSIIFDYDITTRVMIHADKSAERFGLSLETHDVPDVLVRSGTIHPDNAQVFLEMYRQIRAGSPTASCVVQAKMANGQYAWNRITMTNIFDRDGRPVRAVGMLEDIDAQTRREAQLLVQSQQDPLTGLYHKGAAERAVRALLSGPDPRGALFILDLDCFKRVNDDYGHPFGDLVLASSARRIGAQCRQQDILGRIGGDEFIIYLAGELTGEQALRKAKDICDAFALPFSFHGACASISCTVGLSLCPGDGHDFEVLYQKSDLALYACKRTGKNGCALYTPEMNADCAP